jgi:hypothetical protein
MLKRLRQLFGRSQAPLNDAQPPLDPQQFIYVMIPGDIQPLVRGERFEDPIADMLQAGALGSVSGGGSQLDEPYPDGRPRVAFCGIDIDVADRDRALGPLRAKLITLDVPDGTEIHYTVGDAMLLDRYVEGVWQECLPRSSKHPGFGV